MGKMRIISGIYKGREIETPGDERTHPMGARERLALFNMLGPDFTGLLVLDAFAGSGAVGIEALSRGAAKVVFIEKDKKAARVIRGNLERLGIEKSQFLLVAGDVRTVETGEKYDVVVADPPYLEFSLNLVEDLGRFLKDEGILVLSHPGEAPEIAGLKLVKTRKYAQAHLSIYEKVA